MKVHTGSEEKFSNVFFARFEFLLSLQDVFQFIIINTTSVLGIGKFCLAASFHFSFFFSPFPPAAMKSF